MRSRFREHGTAPAPSGRRDLLRALALAALLAAPLAAGAQAREPAQDAAAAEAREPEQDAAAAEAREPEQDAAAAEAREPEQEAAAPEAREPEQEAAAPEAREPDQDAAAAARAAAEKAAERADAPEPLYGPKNLEAYTGIVQRVMADGIVVKRAGGSTDPRALPVVRFAGGVGIAVTGEGKRAWLSLRRGDVVLVRYLKGPPAQAYQVHVLSTAAERARALVERRPKPDHRSFVGYVKRKDGDELIVMNPPAPDPRKRPAEIKAFVREQHTKVELLRDSWDDLRKGDRVKIAFQKGNPRPVDTVQVIWRGGERPLPPGTATRLYHPSFDSSVKDVDGIGETGPVPAAVKQRPRTFKVRVPRPER